MVLICVAAILCIAAFNGMKKGAIRMAASLVAMIITIAVTTFASPKVSEKVKNDTDMNERITQSIYENIIEITVHHFLLKYEIYCIHIHFIKTATGR